jgi:hypothetical protein
MNFSEYAKSHKRDFKKEYRDPKYREFKRAFKKYFGIKGNFGLCPFDNAIDGTKGFMFWYLTPKGYVIKTPPDCVDLEFFIQVKPKARTVIYKHKKKFEENFSDSLTEGYPIELYGDPIKMITGYVVTKESGREWHGIPVKIYKNEK